MSSYNEGYFAQSHLLWSPLNPQFTRIEAFRRYINLKHGYNLKNYDELHGYSVSDYTFWKDLWDFLGIRYSISPNKMLEDGPMPEVPTWFPGAKLNYAENLMFRDDDTIAVTSARETGQIVHYTFKQLRQLVCEMSNAMKAHGVKPRDRIAAIVTNSITAVVLALATTAIGAVFSCTATDMGVQGILDRYRQIEPVIVFSESEVVYATKSIDIVQKAEEVARDLFKSGKLRKLVLLPSTKTNADAKSRLSKSEPLSIFLKAGHNRPLAFEQLPFNHPLYILYSSGTSGPPKCIVHSAGGALLQNKKDGGLHFGFQPDETYFQYTTTAWMSAEFSPQQIQFNLDSVWPYMLSALASGTRIIAYDGSPFYPDVQTFLRLVNDQNVSVLGISPRFLAELQALGVKPLELGTFKALRVLFSTGAVLTPPMFEWTASVFPKHTALFSSSGGTDIIAGIVGSVPSLPVYSGEIQNKLLGMKVDIFDPDGRPVPDGEPGELVVTRPHPSLPLYFWGDHDFKKYREAYFEMFPGIWRQGDFIVRNPKTGGYMILGRSDGVLNPSGVRFGSAEIYSVLEDFTSTIDDFVCVGQRRKQDKDERVFLFLKMRSGHKLTDSLVSQIKTAIRKSRSPRHVPAFIFPIEDIPYTVNNKRIEIAVKQIISGTNVKASGTVANPESLELYRKFVDVERLVRTPAKL